MWFYRGPRSLRGVLWFFGVWITFATVLIGLGLWLTWEDTHGGEAIATVQRVDRYPTLPSEFAAIDDAAWSTTDQLQWQYTSVFVLPDGTRCETTARLFPDDRRVEVGDATEVHYSRWQPCSNVQRADRPRPDMSTVLGGGASMLGISLVVFVMTIAFVRALPARAAAGVTGPEDHGPAQSARRLPGWRP
ncbi:hypothetical protein ACQEVZ_47025 [Dactylosporangium sp. CA-152071]|uniref:hypothetical protein n=1 Tax=Dactylosporangium sp. CA-152071 TaxID=3239933 RepID=UPI003D92874C